MLATISTVDLIDKASDLGIAVIQSEPFQDYLYAKRKLKQDHHSQQLIRDFNIMKEKYEEVQRFGKYHPDYKQFSTQIRELKRSVDSLPTVIHFKQAEKEMESLLNEISGIIARAVSESIKVPTGNPFFDNMPCSGGCASGGGCSC